MGEIEEIKIDATLNCIKDSETILGGEYYVIHSDYIIALEEEIEKLRQPSIIIKIEDIEEIRKIIEEQQQKIDKAVEYLKTFHFIDNIRVLDIKEYEKLLEILGDKENE